MIFLPPQGRAVSSSSRGPLQLRRSFRTGFFSRSSRSLSLASLPHPPTRSIPLHPAGVTQGLTHSLIISSQCTVRNSLVTRTRTHVHRGPASPNPSAPFFHALARSLARSPALVGGHRLLDFIEFSSSARRHPVQTRIRQLTPLACGGSAIKPTVREVRFTARTSPRFFGATRIRDAVKVSLLIFPNQFRPHITRSRFVILFLLYLPFPTQQEDIDY